MRKLRWMVAVACALPFVAHAQLDSIPWTVTLWGQHRSNTLDHEMGRKLVRGGFIDRTMAEAAGDVQGGEMGTFGYATGGDLRWTSNRRIFSEPEGRPGARLCGSLQVKSVGDIRWTPEMYDLVFLGNAGHVGRWDVLDGSQFRTSTWVHAAVGLEGEYQNRAEVGLVFQPSLLEARIRNGYFYVNEAIDSLVGYVRAEGHVSERAGWGIAANAEWHFLREEAPFAFHVRVQNIGFTLVPKEVQYAVDTLIETSGLSLTGDTWSLESLESGTLGSSLYTRDTARFVPRLLPLRLDASFEYPLGPRSGWDVQVQVGEWMPLPRAMTGYRRAIGQHWQAGVQLIAGGWGRLRPAAWARWRMPGERAILLYIEDPFGWGSNAAYGRGITLRYQSL